VSNRRKACDPLSYFGADFVGQERVASIRRGHVARLLAGRLDDFNQAFDVPRVDTHRLDAEDRARLRIDPRQVAFDQPMGQMVGS